MSVGEFSLRIRLSDFDEEFYLLSNILKDSQYVPRISKGDVVRSEKDLG